MPNHCLSSENVDIYFGLWRASFKCLATAKDTELAGKFQPQYAAWWPINSALIFSFLIGIGVLFAGLVSCGGIRVNHHVFICMWHKVSPIQGTMSAASPWAWLMRKLFFKKGRVPAWKCKIVKGNELALLHSRQMGILSHNHWEVNCVKWNILQNATAATHHHTVQNFSGWNPSGFVEDNPEMRCGTWLSRATVVGPVADRKPNWNSCVCCWYRI